MSIQKKANVNAIGQIAECIVSCIYIINGYSILGQRIKTPHGEIDLVFKKDDQLFFIEVKAFNIYAEIENTISMYQLKRISNAGRMLATQFNGDFYQIDIAFVELPKFRVRITPNFGSY